MIFPIEKILVADDRIENIRAAETYFKTQKMLTEHASSAHEAIEKIEESYLEKPYDIVLTDLQMEDEYSGALVAWIGYKHQAYSLIVTGKDILESNGHGNTTSILPLMKYVKGMKSDSAVWGEVWRNVMQHLDTQGVLYNSLKQVRNYVRTPLDSNAEICMLAFPEEYQTGARLLLEKQIERK